MEKKCVRYKDACTYLGISPSTLWRWSEDGRLKSRKIGPRTRVWFMEDLEEFLMKAQFESSPTKAEVETSNGN